MLAASEPMSELDLVRRVPPVRMRCTLNLASNSTAVIELVMMVRFSFSRTSRFSASKTVELVSAMRESPVLMSDVVFVAMFFFSSTLMTFLVAYGKSSFVCWLSVAPP